MMMTFSMMMIGSFERAYYSGGQRKESTAGIKVQIFNAESRRAQRLAEFG
jgi:hypothetical protein